MGERETAKKETGDLEMRAMPQQDFSEMQDSAVGSVRMPRGLF